MTSFLCCIIYQNISKKITIINYFIITIVLAVIWSAFWTAYAHLDSKKEFQILWLASNRSNLNLYWHIGGTRAENFSFRKIIGWNFKICQGWSDHFKTSIELYFNLQSFQASILLGRSHNDSTIIFWAIKMMINVFIVQSLVGNLSPVTVKN